MTKAKLLQPDLILGGPVTVLTPAIAQKYSLKGLILDVDETLVPLNETDITPELRTWMEELRQITAIWLVSNNISENRIGRIARALGVPYLSGAAKPSRRKLRQALAQMELPINEVAMVGDRLFTDILAGNRLGLFTILVEPMVNPEIMARTYAIRNFEVWLSQKLGVSLQAAQHNFTTPDKT